MTILSSDLTADPRRSTCREPTAAAVATTDTTSLSRAFARTAAVAAGASALSALAYSVTFVLFVEKGWHWAEVASSALLLAGGLLGLPVLVALYRRLAAAADEGFALLGLVLGLGAGFGTLLHGAHDLAVLAHPELAPAGTDIANFTDPRGFATFALFGTSLVLLASLMRAARFARGTWVVGLASGLATIVVHVGRVTVLDPKRWWVALAALFSGVVGVPLWNALVARELLRPAKR